MSAKTRSSDRATPVIEFPITMPAIGMTVSASYQGLAPMTSPVTAKVTVSPVTAIETTDVRNSPPGASGARRSITFAAATIMITRIPTTAHHWLKRITQTSTRPSRSSCT